MKEKIKQMRLNITLSAVISVVIGLLLLIYPEQSISAIGKVIALIIIFAGAVMIISQIVDFGNNILGIIVGGIIALIGIWIYASPQAVLTIIPIVIGVMMVVHGVQDLSLALEGSKANASHAWIAYVLAAINIILGFLCIGKAFGLVSLVFRLIGIMLIYDGITDVGIVHGVKKANRDVVDSTIVSEEDVF